jgi:hypothetical protein
VIAVVPAMRDLISVGMAEVGAGSALVAEATIDTREAAVILPEVQVTLVVMAVWRSAPEDALVYLWASAVLGSRLTT